MADRVSTFRLGAVRLTVVSAPLASRPAALTPAEIAVAHLIARGLTNAEIARKRGRAERTIANQVRAILRKLGVATRRGVAAALLRGGG